jgi:hypothetical protein
MNSGTPDITQSAAPAGGRAQPQTYIRTLLSKDGVDVMVEVGPDRFVNLKFAVAFGLTARPGRCDACDVHGVHLGRLKTPKTAAAAVMLSSSVSCVPDMNRRRDYSG